MELPVSGVETYWWVPATVAFGISLLASTGGLSGAFFLLPFQVSILGFTGPAVSPTNLVFNIVAIPSGVYRFWREGRMVWPLVWIIALGTIPGLLVGAFVRINYLPDPSAFKFFVGMVLLYIGGRLGVDIFKGKTMLNKSGNAASDFKVIPIAFGLKRIAYKFNGTDYSVPTMVLFSLSLIVGVIGGIYGIGGGAILAPVLVSVFGLPVYTIAGATLLSTFLSSVGGVVVYSIMALFYRDTGMAIAPDWILGAMFGVGGSIGIYIGARLQRYLPVRLIKAILTACLLFIAVRYIAGFVW
ncbi:MAG: sulfite exporter TauE/SafE family protein [candidate division Zixibacteria bacterium]|nr:sulfite exporter TauE/SafE family protein [candidate division Zixibacteria bacterium]